jgi:hypothetical protein
MSPTYEMENPNVVGPPTVGVGRLSRLERALRADRIVNGGDIEVFPAEQGVGRVLRLSTWIRSRLGLGTDEASKTTEEETTTSDSTVVLLKVTGLHSDSPASGVRMYKGDIYGNGSQSAATSEDVTVRILGVATNVTIPSSGSWGDMPMCGAISATQTWVGASATHTNDTVYETIGLTQLW